MAYENSNKELIPEEDWGSLFPTINPNRVITMVPSRHSNQNDSWKQNLSRLLKTQSDRGDNAITAGMFENLGNPEAWNVRPEIDLLMIENKGLNVTNRPDHPLQSLAAGLDKNKGIVGKIATLAIGGATLISAIRNSDSNATSGVFNPWIAGINTWGGANRAGIDYTFEFSMGQYGLWNAKEEVVKPILNLLAPALPQYLNSFYQYGAFPHALDLLAKFVSDLFGGYTDDTNLSFDTNGLSALASKLEGLALNSYKEFTYDIQFGKGFTFYKMLPLDAEVTLSNDVDQYGYPISGSIRMKFEGLAPVALTTQTPHSLAASFGKGYGTLNKWEKYSGDSVSFAVVPSDDNGNGSGGNGSGTSSSNMNGAGMGYGGGAGYAW